MKYYYKLKGFNTYISLKSPDFDGDPNYIKITEQEFDDYVKSLESESEE